MYMPLVFHPRFYVIGIGESRVLRDAADVGVSACAPTARRTVHVSASQTGERFHQGCDGCSMNNTLPPKGKCLKVVDIIDSLLCPFLCLHLSVVRESKNAFLWEIDAHAFGLLSMVREKWSYRRTKRRSLSRSLSVICPALFAFWQKRVFLVRWHLFTYLCLIDLFLTEPLLWKGKQTVDRRPGSSDINRHAEKGELHFFLSVMPVGNKCLHTWASNNGQFADCAGEEADEREERISLRGVCWPQAMLISLQSSRTNRWGDG